MSEAESVARTEIENLLHDSLLDPSARTPIERVVKPVDQAPVAVRVAVSPERQAWLDARRLGLGGSEISAVLGLDPFRGALDVWLNKVEGYDQPDSPDMERGRFLEQGIIDWYCHRERDAYGDPVIVRTVKSVFNGDLVHPNGIARCTPDGLVNLELGVFRDLSIKAPRRGGDNWGEHGGTKVPMYAAVQLQWEDAVLCANAGSLLFHPTMHLAAMVDGDLRVYTVERDLDFQRELLEAGLAWWQKHVVGKVPPELDGGDGAHAWLRRRFPKSNQTSRPATLPEEVLLAQLSEAAKAFDVAERLRAVARQRVEEAIGEAGGIDGVSTRVTWRARRDGVRVFKPTYAWEKT